MAALPTQHTEEQRLQALHDYGILDTPAEGFFDDVVRLAALACDTPIALVTLVDRNRQWFKAKIGVEFDQTPRDFTLCTYALDCPDELLIVEDALLDPRAVNNPYVVAAPHMRFYAGAPLVTPGGYVLGTLCVIDLRPRNLSDSQKETLELLARRVVVALDVKRELTRLGLLSTTDGLTGLSNRRAFQEKLKNEVSRSRRYDSPLSLILIDVDNFKRFNDTLGHPAGDKLLQTIAESLRHCIRDTDQASRMGGDEFAILLPNTRCDFAHHLAERARTAVLEQYRLAPEITLSIGVAELVDKMDGDALMAAADRALYEAKRKGRNQTVDAEDCNRLDFHSGIGLSVLGKARRRVQQFFR
jgi:diguanylate cyclase (GGDEF)-like protein